MGWLGRSPPRELGQAKRSFSIPAVRVLCLLAVMLSRTSISVAHAQSAEPQLLLDSGASCLEHDRLVARIQRWREHTAVDPSLRVEVRGNAQDPTLIFFFVERSGSPRAERVLRAAPAECDQLHSAVALSIALAVDAMLSGSGDAPPPAPLDAPPPRVERSEEASADSTYEPTLDLAAYVGAGVSLLPGTTLIAVPRLQLGVLPWLAFGLEGLATRTSDETIQNAPGAYDAALVAGGVDACFGGTPTPAVSLFACVGGRGGVFWTRGRNLARRDAIGSPWWAAVVSGQARAWLLPFLAIGIDVEAVYALAARDLVITAVSGGTEQRLAVSRVGLVISAGPIFRFF